MNIKVLVVDNDLSYLDATARFLEVHDYDVYRAVSLERAQQLFDYTWVHVALIDVRMRDDTDRNDTSGLLLAKDSRYRSIPKIMLTQHPSYEYVREALGPDLEGIVPAVDFHSKLEEPEMLIRVLKQTFEQHVRLNRELTISWNLPLTFPYLVNLIQPEQDKERLLDRAGELEDLFRKLFYASAQITIGRVLKHGTGWLLLEVFAYGDAGNERQYIVSCGKKEQIAEESQRYDKVAPQGAGVGSTVKQQRAETLRFAAIAYMLIGGDLEEMVSFRDYYQRRPADAVVASMRQLYSATLPAWYQSGREQQYGASLSELYARGLGLDVASLAVDALRDRLAAITQRMLAAGLVSWINITADKLILRFANGGTFARANPVAEGYDKRINLDVPVLYGVIHGCMDPDSILVDDAGQTWLIDFTRAGQGLLLQDFIAMETAMKLEMIETLDLQARYLLEQRLLETAKLSDDPSYEGLSPELQRMALAITYIRASAAELAGEQFTSYQVGLFFCALRYVAKFDPALQYTRGRLIPYAHSLLLAAMLYDTFNQPIEQPQKRSLPVLRLDQSNESAWLGDKPIDLTPREYQLLKYLYEREGQLCTRQAITDHLLETNYDMTDESWLNSLVNRLRSKLEPDPDHPHYLLTVRGRGYKLIAAPQ